jgi:nucleoside-diphosphate-sugar epimerase
MKVLVIGSAGFIGSALSIRLLDRPASPNPDSATYMPHTESITLVITIHRAHGLY